MKYLKLFEASRTDELKQFCNDNLAYLIDKNFNFVVRVSREAQIQSDSNFQTTIKYPSNSRYDTIVVEKFTNSLQIMSEVFDFNEFSDDLIPFILFLSEKYGIRGILYLDGNRKIKWPSTEYNDRYNLDLSSLDNSKIKKLIITIKK
jgi:hypothetical protein